MGLCSEVVDLIGLNLTNQYMCIARIRQITVVEEDPPIILNVRQEMIDPLRTRRTMTTNHAMYLIALFKQQLGQIGAVLSCNTGD